MNTTTPSPLLWVNHNAGSRKAEPRRHAIRTHVHGSYKRWKRQEDALSLRKPAKFLGSSFAHVQKVGTDVLPKVLDSGKTTVGNDIPDCGHTGLEVIPAQVNPQTILAKGNSDPFDSFGIPIDGNVARLMTYTADLYLPGIYRHHNLADRRTASTQAFNEIITFLQDECTAYPHLARIVAVMPRGSAVGTGSLAQSVIFKTKGLASLRKRLMSPDSLLDPKISASVLLFLTAEVYDSNLEAALFHARILAYILQSSALPMDFWFLFKAMYHDMQRACLGLTRPAFDLETWIPKQLASLSFTTLEAMPEDVNHENCRQVDASITNPLLKDLIIEMKHCREMRLLMSQDQSPVNNHTNWQFGCRTMACVGRIVNHYLDSKALMEMHDGVNRRSLRAARADAYTSLALLYLIRCEANMDKFQIGDKDTIFRANPRIMTEMKELLEQDKLNTEGNYSRTKLFVLFVGALAEQLINVDYGAPEKEWFNVKLATQSARMGIWTWKDLRKTLLSFYYSDSILPHGSVWFWKTLNANAGGSP